MSAARPRLYVNNTLTSRFSLQIFPVGKHSARESGKHSTLSGENSSPRLHFTHEPAFVRLRCKSSVLKPFLPPTSIVFCIIARLITTTCDTTLSSSSTLCCDNEPNQCSFRVDIFSVTKHLEHDVIKDAVRRASARERGKHSPNANASNSRMIRHRQ